MYVYIYIYIYIYIWEHSYIRNRRPHGLAASLGAEEAHGFEGLSMIQYQK